MPDVLPGNWKDKLLQVAVGVGCTALMFGAIALFLTILGG